jgi:hypothetical protein
MARHLRCRSASSSISAYDPGKRRERLPTTYTIDEESAIVRVEWFGVLTNQDMLDCLARLHNDPARKPGMPSLVDCRGVERMMVTPSGVQAAVMVQATMVDRRQPPWAVAVIAPQDEVFWMARTYEVLRAGSPETVRVFRQPAAAKRWLDTFKARSHPAGPKRSLTSP